MKHNKSFTKIACILLILSMIPVFCASCGKEEQEEKPEEPSRVFTKIADHLYETTYTEDFNWDYVDEPALSAAAGSAFACSGVQNGQYRGRNYDWNYADTDILIIHAAVTENRPHASVGVSDLSFVKKENDLYNTEKPPFVTVDGINDAGVCIQVNVMPYGENGEIPHTETTEDDLPGARVVRYVLDYADSVEHALQLLKEKDVHSEFAQLEELHWLISGPASTSDSTTKTVILEILPTGMNVIEEFVDGKPIITNFCISNFDGSPASLGIGFGYERWQILVENYDQADSVMGTLDLMEKVFYTKAYDLYSGRPWYSEFNGYNLCEYYDADTLKQLLGEKVYNYYMENYGGVYYTAALWDGETDIHGDISKTGLLAAMLEAEMKNYQEQDMDAANSWITIHTSVYDLANKTLDLQVRESHDHLRFTIQ